jgi:hypothetical protein
MTSTATALQLDAEQTAKLHALYRHLHAHPELSMQEFATATLIEEQLDGWALSISAAVAQEWWVSCGTAMVLWWPSAPIPMGSPSRKPPAWTTPALTRARSGRHRGAGYARLWS